MKEEKIFTLVCTDNNGSIGIDFDNIGFSPIELLGLLESAKNHLIKKTIDNQYA